MPAVAAGPTNPEKGATTVVDIASGAATAKVEEPKGVIILKSLKDAGREVDRNSGASLIDLGDGVACCEFHSKMNAIGADLDRHDSQKV